MSTFSKFENHGSQWWGIILKTFLRGRKCQKKFGNWEIKVAGGWRKKIIRIIVRRGTWRRWTLRKNDERGNLFLEKKTINGTIKRSDF